MKKLASIAEQEIAHLAKSLPDEVRTALRELPVHLQARPDADISAELGDDILGLFSGEALHERGETLSPTPPQIHLFL
ncbi:MAG: hypothetical protein GVY36_00965, partial [Verrucomicrobia bacterium]|nr:hypothetical protein [Verrucomicrobiota bacterium]